MKKVKIASPYIITPGRSRSHDEIAATCEDNLEKRPLKGIAGKMASKNHIESSNDVIQSINNIYNKTIR